MDVIPWLLDGDPSIRWQTMRDLLDESEAKVERERRKVAREGWGARLLAKQDSDGRWAAGQTGDDGMYSPKWTSTTYTMLLLRDFGLLPNRGTDKACKQLLDRGLREDGGMLFGKWGAWLKRGEQCVTGMVLSILRYFECDDARVDRLEKNLLSLQMDDGGWNCRRPQGATHSSFNTTISALEALRDRKAQKRGREFLLQHRLFRSHTTGNVVKSDFTRLSFPARWHYDVLRALEHFQSTGAPRDERAAEAIELVVGKRRSDGRWPLENSYRGKVYFELERVGAPSRWNTLRALRVLRWWSFRAP